MKITSLHLNVPDMLTFFDKAVHNVVLRLGRQAPGWPLDVASSAKWLRPGN